jgi:hypothetical protein
MNLKQIKAAVKAGKTVHWASTAYEVIHDTSNGCDQWLIAYARGTRHANYIGLTWTDGVTMNCNSPDEFFIGKGRA